MVATSAYADLVDELRERRVQIAQGGSESARAKHTARGKMLARDRIDALVDRGSPFLEVATARRLRDVRGGVPWRGRRRRHRARARPTRHDRRERRHGEGWGVLPDHREEAPPCAGDRRREQAALHLPGRFGRRLPADAGRGLPRPRPLRADLLQSSAHVARRHPADRRGAGAPRPQAARTCRP